MEWGIPLTGRKTRIPFHTKNWSFNISIYSKAQQNQEPSKLFMRWGKKSQYPTWLGHSFRMWETQVQVPGLPVSGQGLKPGSSLSQMSALPIGLLATLGWLALNYIPHLRNLPDTHFITTAMFPQKFQFIHIYIFQEKKHSVKKVPIKFSNS